VAELAEKKRGLVLVTGPSGSGKSTTLASMIDKISKQSEGHIITIEDPIEFIHAHQGCLVSQREVSTDVRSFAQALRSALREDPDVVLVGEMRDLETVSLALRIAETGHLTLATLHTNSAQSTVNRIIDVFPPHQQEQVRRQLSLVLEGIVCQRLLPEVKRVGSVVATEILIPTAGIRNLIREKRDHQIYSLMQTGQGRFGMHTMNQSLARLLSRQKVDYDVAIAESPDTTELKEILRLRGITASAKCMMKKADDSSNWCGESSELRTNKGELIGCLFTDSRGETTKKEPR
jgi:twitching motility protein PilT